jgi:hypothetical protein
MSKAGVDVPVTAIVGVPLAVGIFAAVLYRIRPPVPQPTREAVAAT